MTSDDGRCASDGARSTELATQVLGARAAAVEIAVPRFPPPPPICAETCNWASDADCDDGSPGSEFSDRPRDQS